MKKILTEERGRTLRPTPCCVALFAALVLTASVVRAGAKPTTIAALPFRDSSPGGKYAPLADGKGDLLAAFLAKSDRLVVVERAALDKVLKEQRLSLTGLVDPKTKAKVGRLLGAKYILSGGLTVVGGKLHINAHLFEVKTTRVALSAKAEGKVNDLFTPARQLAGKLARVIDVKLPEIKESDIDKSPVANLHFMRGLGYYYGKMPDHAIAEFMKALALKRDHARARYWNGRCYFDGKEYEHALIEFERFLKDFPKHDLAGNVRKMRDTCSVELKKGPTAKPAK